MRKPTIKSAMLAMLIGAICSPAHGQPPQAEAIDGDTLRIHDTYFRLARADTPEQGQPGYRKATRVTQNWLDNNAPHKQCRYVGHGKYGRPLLNCPDLRSRLRNYGVAEIYD